MTGSDRIVCTGSVNLKWFAKPVKTTPGWLHPTLPVLHSPLPLCVYAQEGGEDLAKLFFLPLQRREGSLFGTELWQPACLFKFTWTPGMEGEIIKGAEALL